MAVAVALSVTACGGGGDDSGGEPAGNGQVEALPVTVTASDFAFSPDRITGHATHTIDLTVVNEDDADHTFTVDDLDVDVEAAAGAEAETSFTSDETGTFEFYCRFHPDQMSGQLSIE